MKTEPIQSETDQQVEYEYYYEHTYEGDPDDPIAETYALRRRPKTNESNPTTPPPIASPTLGPLSLLCPLPPPAAIKSAEQPEQPEEPEYEYDNREPLPVDDHGYDLNGVRQIYCIWTYDGGHRCRALARKGTRLCYWHDPATEEQRQTGFLKTYPTQEPKPMMADAGPMATGEALDALLAKVAHYLATSDRPDTARAYALTNVVKHLLKSLELQSLQSQLEQARANFTRLQSQPKTDPSDPPDPSESPFRALSPSGPFPPPAHQTAYVPYVPSVPSNPQPLSQEDSNA